MQTRVVVDSPGATGPYRVVSDSAAPAPGAYVGNRYIFTCPPEDRTDTTMEDVRMMVRQVNEKSAAPIDLDHPSVTVDVETRRDTSLPWLLHKRLQGPPIMTETATPAKPVAPSPASQVAADCLKIARQLSPHQNEAELRLTSGNVTTIVNACLSAGNLLGGITRLDPAGPPPVGWARKTEFDAGGNLVVIFTPTDGDERASAPT